MKTKPRNRDRISTLSHIYINTRAHRVSSTSCHQCCWAFWLVACQQVPSSNLSRLGTLVYIKRFIGNTIHECWVALGFPTRFSLEKNPYQLLEAKVEGPTASSSNTLKGPIQNLIISMG